MLWIAVAAVVVLIVVASLATRKPDPFKAAAATLGLQLTRSVPELLPRLEGMTRGFAVKTDIAGQRDPAVRYRVFYPALEMALRLEPETTISRTLGQLGSGDQEIGAKAFDDTFRVNTSRPDALQEMMTPRLRQRLVELAQAYPGVVVADGDITLTSDTLTPTAESIIATITDLVDVAAELVAVRPPALKTPELRPEPERKKQPIEAPSPATTAAPEPAAEPARPVDEPGVPEPIPVRKPVDIEPDAPTPDPVRSTGLPEEFFEDVFGESRLSFESDDSFEREFKGRTVHLSGPAKQSSPYENRTELSPTSGTKAVITVAQIDSDLYGKTDIDAVVYLKGSIELPRGDSVSFTGTIDSVDAFMRNLIVTDASLTNE